MQCLQLTRGEPPATTIAVTITGTGHSTCCYAIINGTTQYKAGTYEVNAGDTITFGVKGRNSFNTGYVKIDGTQVLEVTDTSTQTYDWTVPNGISTVKIAMNYDSRAIIGIITVTTDGELSTTMVDVALSGSFDKSYGYVIIDGTQYTSKQTLTVAKGTSVTVFCSSGNSFIVRSKITLNGTTVAEGTSSAGAEYTFAVTDNCTITVTRKNVSGYIYYYADITMPA